MKFNQILQLSRLQYLFTKDVVLNRELYTKKCLFSKKDEYSLKILNNLSENYNDNVYKCLSILLSEKSLNRKVFFDKLLKYRYFDSHDEKIVGENDIEFCGGYKTIFDDFNNALSYNIKAPKDKLETMLHEFYHFAAFSKYEAVICNGFKKGKVGKGLNEGFTQYLTNLAINNDNMSYEGINGPRAYYPFCTMYAKALTSILGLDGMKDNYFNKGLDGLIEDVYSIYPDMNKIMNFVKNMDYLYLTDGGKKSDKQESLKVINEIDSFLIDLCMKKYDDPIVLDFLPKSISKVGDRLFPTDLLYEAKKNKESKK